MSVQQLLCGYYIHVSHFNDLGISINIRALALTVPDIFYISQYDKLHVLQCLKSYIPGALVTNFTWPWSSPSPWQSDSHIAFGCLPVSIPSLSTRPVDLSLLYIRLVIFPIFYVF